MGLEWDFWVFVAALSVAAMTPGPGLAALVATVLASGARRAIWFCAGIIAGDLVWLALSLSGLALVAQNLPFVFLVIKWGGVAYLCYLAWRIWRAPVGAGETLVQPREQRAVARALAGFSVTMGNPKAMLFYLALLPNIVSPEDLSAPLILSLCLAVVVVLALVFAVYVMAAERARVAMRNLSAMRRFNRLTASALGGAAVWIASN